MNQTETTNLTFHYTQIFYYPSPHLIMFYFIILCLLMVLIVCSQLYFLHSLCYCPIVHFDKLQILTWAEG